MKKTISVLLCLLLIGGSIQLAFADTQYVVKDGDWLSRIAQKYNTTYQTLADHNGITNPHLIYPGQILNIPDSAAPVPAAPATPAPPAEPVVPETPVVSETPASSGDPVYDSFLEKIDVEYSASVTDKIAANGSDEQTGFRNAGSTGELAAADYLVEEFKNAGLQNVKKESMTVDTWNYKTGQIIYTDAQGQPQTIILGGYATTMVADQESVDVVYAGTGRTADYEGIDAQGKLVIVDVDQFNDFWISKPAYEAKLHGAKAVLAVPSGGYGQHSDETLSTQDICGPEDAPAFNISVKDANALKGLIENAADGSVAVTFTADSQVKRNGTSYNIVGEIPGKNPDEIIFMMGHYDGYFHQWHDNASGVGMGLGIIKALVDSGYQPEKTLVMVAHGSEEWGIADSKYDWAIGSFRQIMTNHPEWQEKGFVAMNFESGCARDDDSSFFLKSGYELNSIVQQLSAGYDGVRPSNGNIKIESPTTTWTEDYSYAIAGIPTMVHSRENRAYSESTYHTNMDVKNDHYSAEHYEYAHKIHGLIYLGFDRLAVRPVDYTASWQAFKDNINDTYYPDAAAATSLADQAIASAEKLTAKITAMNEAYAEAVETGNAEEAATLLVEAKAFNKELYQLNKSFYDDFSKLDWGDNLAFPTTQNQANLEQLNVAISALETEDIDTAMDEALWQIDDNYGAYGMSRETYDYFIHQALGQSDDRLAWGAGRLVSGNLDLYDVIQTLAAKQESGATGFSAEIEVLKQGITDQQQKLAPLAAKEQTDLKTFIDAANALVQ